MIKRKYPRSWKARASAAKKRKYTPRKSIRGRVNKILRFIKENKPEVKKAIYTVNSSQLNDGTLKSWNLMYYAMAQGVGENQFTGKKVHLKGIAVKVRITNECQSGLAVGYSNGHQRNLISVVGHKDYTTTTNLDINQINATEYGSFNTFSPHYDSDKIKIYKQKRLDLKGLAPGVDTNNNPNPTGSYPRVVTSSFYVPMKKDLVFERWSQDYKLKGLNLYLLIQSNALDQVSYTYYGALTFQVTLYYTDD